MGGRSRKIKTKLQDYPIELDPVSKKKKGRALCEVQRKQGSELRPSFLSSQPLPSYLRQTAKRPCFLLTAFQLWFPLTSHWLQTPGESLDLWPFLLLETSSARGCGPDHHCYKQSRGLWGPPEQLRGARCVGGNAILDFEQL